LLKARQLEKWHNIDTSNIKVHVNPQDFTREQQISIDWYKKLREQLASKHYLEVNYERDLENLNIVHLYELFDPWFEKINIPVNKSNYKLKYFKKQDKTPIENSILNYSEVKKLII
jgi:hypothetical protein